MKSNNPAVWVGVLLVGLLAGIGQANWSDTFNDGEFDVATWQFLAYPALLTTFSHDIQTGVDGNDYLALAETSSVGAGGSAFGGGFGADEVFTDVRVGAVVNVVGDASRNFHGLLGRTEYIIDDGSISGAPGIIASCYVLLMNWEDGPANLRLELQKVVQLSNIMDNSEALGLELRVPGLDHARSYYAELDIVGSGPVYVTGSLYEYKGGPLVARTATMVDTSGNDPWEDEDEHDAVFTAGVSGITGFNEDPEPAGYYTTFDDVFSVSDGPAAVNPSPADGAADVSINTGLNWLEAEFATDRRLSFGKAGAMELVEPAPTGAAYTPGPLEYGQTYQWRVDQIGPSGVVEGHTWTFSTGECLPLDDFESYANDAAIESAWPHNIPPAQAGPYHYVFVETDNVNQGAKSMRFEYQNQYSPYLTEATRTFATARDWAGQGITSISMVLGGEDDNVVQQTFVKLEDATGASYRVPHPQDFACQSEAWRQWDIDLAEFADNGVDLSAVKKISIGTGNGTTASTQGDQDRDTIYIDNIRMCPLRCFNSEQLDLQGDVNGDCVINFLDLALMGVGWLNDGLSVTP